MSKLDNWHRLFFKPKSYFSLIDTLSGYVFPFLELSGNWFYRCEKLRNKILCFRFNEVKGKLIVETLNGHSSHLSQVVNNVFDLGSDYVKLIDEKVELEPEVKKRLFKVSGYRLFSSNDPFEIIVSAIISQNVNFATFRSLLKKFVQIIGTKVDDAFWVFPSPIEVITCKDQLKNVKLGYRNEAILNICKFALENTLPNKGDTMEIVKELVKVKGVGYYTASSYTLFALKRFDTPIWDRFITKHILNPLINVDVKTFKEFEKVTDNLWGEVRGLVLAMLIASFLKDLDRNRIFKVI